MAFNHENYRDVDPEPERREPSAHAQIVPPLAGTDDAAALRFEVETTPGHSIGSVIRPFAARCLIRELQTALNEIPDSSAVEGTCGSCGTPLTTCLATREAFNDRCCGPCQMGATHFPPAPNA
ncbi:hypothetical protein ACQP2T_63930 (plasmid) [Nonomuraea sp. CA-143628]|uniref:hypothetical protein n=1 Tax=Nonomuraea sp. CA-143628 TaxID=3239997 RepID=UPI003D9438EE